MMTSESGEMHHRVLINFTSRLEAGIDLMQMTYRDWVSLIFLSVLWGGTFFFTEIAVEDIPPLTLVLIRISLAALILYIYLSMRGEKLPRESNALTALLIMGTLNIVFPFSLFFWAQTKITASLASILNAATPIFSILIAHQLLTDEKMTAPKVIGVCVGFTGVIVLLGGDLITGISATTLGIIACLIGVIFQGFSVTYARRFKTMRLSNSVTAFGQLFSATLVLTPIALLVEQPWRIPPPATASIVATLALALFSTALAYVIYFSLLASAGAVNTSLSTLLIPFSAMLLGMGFLGERLELQQWFGMGLITTGLLIIDGRPVSALRQRLF